MGTKGEQTKEQIRAVAYTLFAKKGFKAVTMKDICEEAGLSRGGLYRHYDSTRTIFEEIFLSMADDSYSTSQKMMGQNLPAAKILEVVLQNLREEMLDAEKSLSLAIYEYANEINKDLFIQLNEKGRKRWKDLIIYGMAEGAFKQVNCDQVIDMFVYAYQGVRMWSRVLPLDENTTDHIIDTMREMLLVK